MSRKRSPLFLERRSYRLRRVMDGARLLPFVGAALWAVPLLWGQAEAEDMVRTSRAALYVFLVWVALVALAFFLSRWLVDSAEGEDGPGEGG